MMDKVHVCMFLHIASFKSTAGNRTSFFSSPVFISTSRYLILAKAFGNDDVAAPSTALRSATEKIEMHGYLTFPCWSILTQRSSTEDWLKF